MAFPRPFVSIPALVLLLCALCSCSAAFLVVPDAPAGSGDAHRDGQIPLVQAETPLFLQRSPSEYAGHRLIRLVCTSESAQEMIQLLENLHTDIWAVHRPSSAPEKVAVTVRVDPQQYQLVSASVFSGTGVDFELLRDDLQVAVDRESMELAAATAAGKEDPADPETWFKNYHRRDAILKFYTYLQDTYPHLIKLVPSVGKTFEGRDLFAVHITSSTNGSDASSKKRIWFQSNIHAREWISGAVTQYVVRQLVDGFEKGDEFVKDLLTDVEIVLIPIVNPDGYEYTWTNARLWRKNRHPGSFGAVGVDINRNYPEGWGTAGGSNSPFSEIYQGPHAGSELETKALMKYMLEMAPGLIGAIDFHSYSQLILRPWGFKESEAPDETKLRAAGEEIRKGILAQSGKQYSNEREIDLYAASGTAEDFFYGADVKKAHGGHRVYGFTIELRPSPDEGGAGGDGFILPPRFIVPTGQEIWSGLKNWFTYVRKNDLGER
ncbi:carboxypeptidase [Hyaloraphidium curvatum]|nr:carboxypeptidase [Hyaloraphidium curvatum]